MDTYNRAYDRQLFLYENSSLLWTILFIVIYIIGIGLLGSWLAKKKNYSAKSWFFICTIFNFFGLIALAGAPVQKMIISDDDSSENIIMQ